MDVQLVPAFTQYSEYFTFISLFHLLHCKQMKGDLLLSIVIRIGQRDMADAFEDFRDDISNSFVMLRMRAACLTLGRQAFVCVIHSASTDA